MHKNFPVIVASLLASAGLAGAAQINLSSNSPPTVIGADGIALNAGNGFVITGSFLGGLDNAAIQANIADLAAVFTQFGTDTQVDFNDGPSPDGIFIGGTSQPLAEGDPLDGATIFVIAGAGTGLADATAVAVFRSTDMLAFDDPAFSIDQAVGDMEVVIGEMVDISIPGGPTLNGVQVVPVPEPSTGVLLGLGALALLRRKRRS